MGVGVGGLVGESGGAGGGGSGIKRGSVGEEGVGEKHLVLR